MSALTLRTFAILFMLIDHIGYYASISLFRMIGRLALPIFAFLIANGFRHTRSVFKYALRLFVCAIVSEFAFDICFNGRLTLLTYDGIIPHPMLDNIFFTLLIGLCFLVLHDTYKKKSPRLAPVLSAVTFLILSFGASFVGADYGWRGVMWVALFGIFDAQKSEHRLPLCISSVLLSLWPIISKTLIVPAFGLAGIQIQSIPILSTYFFGGDLSMMDKIQPLAVLSFALILFYNGKSGMPKNRGLRLVIQYAFYAFYPLHLFVLYLIF